MNNSVQEGEDELSDEYRELTGEGRRHVGKVNEAERAQSWVSKYLPCRGCGRRAQCRANRLEALREIQISLFGRAGFAATNYYTARRALEGRIGDAMRCEDAGPRGRGTRVAATQGSEW